MVPLKYRSFSLLIILSIQCAAQASWTQVADYGGGPCSFTPAGVINGKGYVACDNELWEYDPATDEWNQKANFPGSPRVGAVSFVINNILYFGTGNILFGALLNDWWRYDSSTDTWSQLNNFGGAARYAAVGFSIGSKGYIATGFATGSIYKNDIWEYNPASDSWTQRTNLPDAGKYLATGFSLSGKGYVVTGYESVGGDVKDVWEYNPSTNSWVQKVNFPGVARRQSTGFASSMKGYIATGGTSTSVLTDAWEYDASSDAWTSLPSLPAGGRRSAAGFAISNYAYLGIGFVPSGTTYQDFWKLEIEAEPILPVELISFEGSVTDEGNLLTWSTASELNNDYFSIERSNNGEYFNTIAVIDGNGNSSSLTAYSYLDDAATEALNYYRLRQTDFDGAISYSPVIVLSETLSGFNVLVGNPADAIASLLIESPYEDVAVIAVYDISGNVVHETTEKIVSGVNNLQLDLTRQASGSFFIVIRSSNGSVIIQKLIII